VRTIPDIMIAPTDYLNVRRWLDGCRRPLVVSHRRPDGDALGALAGFALTLQELRLEPTVALYEPFPPRYANLADLVDWRRCDQDQNRQAASLAAACDALVILDTCTFSQLEPIADFVRRAPRTLVIDHHPTRDDIGTRAGDLRIYDESAAATCVLIAEWVRAAGLPLRSPVAAALFTGIATDSGWFRFSNVDARTLRVAADLVAAGADPQPIYEAIYERDPAPRLRLIARVLSSLALHAGGQLAVLTLRQADFAAAGADRTMTEDLVNEAGHLAGLEATLMFTEEPDGLVHINFRSKRRLDVAALASRLGGGGHARAAGARPKGVWDEIVPRVIAATVAALAREP